MKNVYLFLFIFFVIISLVSCKKNDTVQDQISDNNQIEGSATKIYNNQFFSFEYPNEGYRVEENTDNAGVLNVILWDFEDKQAMSISRWNPAEVKSDLGNPIMTADLNKLFEEWKIETANNPNEDENSPTYGEIDFLGSKAHTISYYDRWRGGEEGGNVTRTIFDYYEIRYDLLFDPDEIINTWKFKLFR